MGIGNGWTGGQYSLFRATFAVYLLLEFIKLLPSGGRGTSLFASFSDEPARPLISSFPNPLAMWDSQALVVAFTALGLASGVMLMIGFRDRAAAIALCYVWVCLLSRDSLNASLGPLYVAALLVAHAGLPRAPYGSWDRRGQIDPGSDWRMPQTIYITIWILMALGYAYSGYASISGSPPDASLGGTPRAALWAVTIVELSFAPLAAFNRTRPVIWGLALVTQVMLHLFTFDPAWVGTRKAEAAEMIFYDGHCGLCHRAVRFVLAEDRSGAGFRFSPLDSAAFRAAVPAGGRAALPDSLILRAADGTLLSRSAATLHIMKRLGGVWGLLAGLIGLVPRAIRDGAYDRVARLRHRLFRAPSEACPIMPDRLRNRFDY